MLSPAPFPGFFALENIFIKSDKKPIQTPRTRLFSPSHYDSISSLGTTNLSTHSPLPTRSTNGLSNSSAQRSSTIRRAIISAAHPRALDETGHPASSQP